MPQYAVLMFEKETPGGYEDFPPEVQAAHAAVDARMVEEGGVVVAGVAFQPTGASTTIRSGIVTDGPFIESKEALAGITVIEARDLDHALALARLVPIVSGGVEVRPLLGFQVLEDT